MASLSGSTNVRQTAQGLSNVRCNFSLTVNEVSGSKDIANNTTTVRISVSATLAGLNYSGSTRSNAGYLEYYVNGTRYTTTVPLTGGDTVGKTLASASRDVAIVHDNDGSRTISLSLRMVAGSDPYNYNIVWETTSTTSTTLKLTNIERASIPTYSPQPLLLTSTTNKLTIQTNRKSDSFTHSILLSIFKDGSTVADDALYVTGVEEETTLNVPRTWLQYFNGTETQHEARLSVITYNGTTQIGDQQYATVILQVDPNADSPFITAVAVTDLNTQSKAIEASGHYIANASRLRFAVSVIERGGYTNLDRVDIKVGNVTHTLTLSGASSNVSVDMANPLTASSAVITAYDKRGNSISETKTWTLDSYNALNAVGTVKRVTMTGSQGRLTVEGKFDTSTYNTTKNSIKVSYKYRLSGSEGAYTSGAKTYTFTPSGSGFASYSQSYELDDAFDYQRQYEVVVTVSDLLTTVTFTAVLNQGIPVYQYTDGLFGVNGNLYVHNRENPYEYLLFNTEGIRHYSANARVIPANSSYLVAKIADGNIDRENIMIIGTVEGSISPYYTFSTLYESGETNLYVRNELSSMVENVAVNVIVIDTSILFHE